MNNENIVSFFSDLVKVVVDGLERDEDEYVVLQLNKLLHKLRESEILTSTEQSCLTALQAVYDDELQKEDLEIVCLRCGNCFSIYFRCGSTIVLSIFMGRLPVVQEVVQNALTVHDITTPIRLAMVDISQHTRVPLATEGLW